MKKADEVRQAAALVGAEHQRYLEAEAGERSAERALLAQVVLDALPALPALMSVVPGTSLRAARLCVVSARRVLWIFPDGAFGFTADDYEVIQYANLDAMLDDGWRLVQVLDGLLARLREQVRGNKAQATDKINARAARFQALLLLIK